MVSASSTWSRAVADGGVPAVEAVDELAEGGAGLGREAAVGGEEAGGVEERDAVVAGGAVDLLQRLVAEAALGDVDDALEGEAVVGGDGDAEVGHGVADLLALVEARAADDAVGEADGEEAVLEGAHLVGGADEDGDAFGADRVEAAGAAGEGLDLLADPARLLLAVPVADEADLLAVGEVGPEGLAEAALVGGDDAGGGGEDVRGGAVVLLEPDDLRAGEVLLEAEDVADLGAAPAVDRLVVVADAADVVVGAGEEAEPEVLGDVGVLVFVDEDVAEPALVLGEDVGVVLEDGDGVEQEVAEVAGVEGARGAAGRRRRARCRGGRRRRIPRRGRARAGAARFFQPSMRLARRRGGQRFSSMFAAWMSWRSRRSWSSVSRMVKFDLRPTSSAWRRRMRTESEWKVPSQGMPSMTPPTRWPTRAFISRAALLVKVTARISLGQARPVLSRWAMRAVSAVVLPVPAPARTSTGPSSASTAARCAGLRSSR